MLLEAKQRLCDLLQFKQTAGRKQLQIRCPQRSAVHGVVEECTVWLNTHHRENAAVGVRRRRANQ